MKNILFTLALLISFVSFGQTADEYYDRGYDKIELKDNYGAIADFTKAIELDPNLFGAYYNRGISKYYLGDKNSACQDALKSQDLGYDASELIKIVCN
ncbi:hypothetical protein N9P25_01110 [Flavobacteriaceae bacterium]|nr:hypothetical protein [Flavobacteriaceae bacterium]